MKLAASFAEIRKDWARMQAVFQKRDEQTVRVRTDLLRNFAIALAQTFADLMPGRKGDSRNALERSCRFAPVGALRRKLEPVNQSY
jgi:hypothetical protein